MCSNKQWFGFFRFWAEVLEDLSIIQVYYYYNLSKPTLLELFSKIIRSYHLKCTLTIFIFYIRSQYTLIFFGNKCRLRGCFLFWNNNSVSKNTGKWVLLFVKLHEAVPSLRRGDTVIKYSKRGVILNTIRYWMQQNSRFYAMRCDSSWRTQIPTHRVVSLLYLHVVCGTLLGNDLFTGPFM